MRAERHVGKRDVSGHLANTESQVGLNVGSVRQINVERRHNPDVGRAGIELDREFYEDKSVECTTCGIGVRTFPSERNVRSVLEVS